MERAVVHGITLEQEVAGAGETLVYIHGAFVADAHRPLFVEPALADRHRLIAYHRRGYVGSSRMRRAITISEQAADCRRLLGQLGVERAHVVGHSLGASIALQLALDSPQIVCSLALLEPALFVGASAAAYRAAQSRIAQRWRDGESAELLLNEALHIRWPDHPTRLEEASGSATLHPRFAETHDALLQWLPNSEGFVLPEATHFLHMETPQRARQLAEEIAAFVARHPAGTHRAGDPAAKP